MDSDDDGAERAALDAWLPLAPPADFAARVLAARDAAPAPAPRRSRRPLVLGLTAGVVAAAALALVLLRSPGRAARGTVTATTRASITLGDRGVAVVEPAAALTWSIDSHGAAELEQRAGNVFYRVERGEAFVVHTPAGDVRVTGTCFRIEVNPMKPGHKLILSGAAGALLASTVLITVYEGHVVADTRSGRTELAAGTRATLGPDGTTTTAPEPTAVASVADAPFDLAHATRDELVVRAQVQRDEITRLKNRLSALEHAGGAPGGDHASSAPEPGRLWHDPSPEKLAQWATECHVRLDEPDLDTFAPLKKAEDLGERGLEPGELDAYNTTMGEITKQWQALVRALYLEATGDTAGAESLSLEAMQNEIREKSPRDEMGIVLEKLARERAGLQPPPPEGTKLSPLERLMRALATVGDDTEAALAKRLGAKRAHELRGDGWQHRSDYSGCNKRD